MAAKVAIICENFFYSQKNKKFNITLCDDNFLLIVKSIVA